MLQKNNQNQHVSLCSRVYQADFEDIIIDPEYEYVEDLIDQQIAKLQKLGVKDARRESLTPSSQRKGTLPTPVYCEAHMKTFKDFCNQNIYVVNEDLESSEGKENEQSEGNDPVFDNTDDSDEMKALNKLLVDLGEEEDLSDYSENG